MSSNLKIIGGKVVGGLITRKCCPRCHKMYRVGTVCECGYGRIYKKLKGKIKGKL